MNKIALNSFYFRQIPLNPLQPLDVPYFRPIKASWRRILEEWKVKNPGVLPRTLFPRMLKSAVESLGSRKANNIRAGFKAYGLIPFSPESVLRNIKRKESSQPQAESSMTQVLVDHLRQLQAGHIDGPKRGKRINIEPGKSVTAANLRQAKKNFHEELEKRKTQLSDSNDEDEPCNTDVLEPGERGFINQEDYEIGEASTALENIPENETNPNTFKVRDFVIGKYSTNKRDRLYLSQITEVVDNISLCFMRFQTQCMNLQKLCSRPRVLLVVRCEKLWSKQN